MTLKCPFIILYNCLGWGLRGGQRQFIDYVPMYQRFIDQCIPSADVNIMYGAFGYTLYVIVYGFIDLSH